MKICLLAILVLLNLSSSAFATSWWGFEKAINDNSVFYFDMDTVIKGDNKVTLWLKHYVNDKSKSPNAGYSYANRTIYDCKSRKTKILASSIYNSMGNFVESDNKPGPIEDIVPGTISEGILTAVCNKDFPLKKNNELYSIVDKNDTKADATKYFNKINLSKTDSSPNSNANWYVFNRAFNDNIIYFFDAKTIEKKDNKIKLWVKYVNKPDKPDNDGSYATATRMEFNCLNNNYQSLVSSIFNKDNIFIKSFNNASTVATYADNSMFAEIKKSICNNDISKIVDNDDYFKVVDNDIFRHTYDYYKRAAERMVDNAPK